MARIGGSVYLLEQLSFASIGIQLVTDALASPLTAADQDGRQGGRQCGQSRVQ